MTAIKTPIASTFDDDDDEVLTVDEVATMFKIPRSWVYEHVRRRAKLRIPSFKVGKYNRFWRNEVRAFFRQKCVSASMAKAHRMNSTQPTESRVRREAN